MFRISLLYNMNNWCLRSLVTLIAICVIFLQGKKNLGAFDAYLLLVVRYLSGFTCRRPWSLCYQNRNNNSKNLCDKKQRFAGLTRLSHNHKHAYLAYRLLRQNENLALEMACLI